MPGFSDTILYADNVDFRGVSPVIGQMTQDGELLIGSSVAPYIRSSLLTSSDGSITFTTGNGILSLQAVSTPLTFKTDSTNATPSGNQIIFKGGSGITTAGSGNTVTITNTQAPISTPISPANGGTGIVNNNASTLTISGNFASTFTMTNITGVTFPTSGTLATTAQLPSITATQYDVLVGGAANAITSVGPGSAGQVLQSGGNAANPAYSTATYPAVATSANTFLKADGTNWVASASTLILGGNLTTSGGFASTFTMTNTTGVTFPTSGTLATTAQLPTLPLATTSGGTGSNLTIAQGDILYGSAANTITNLAKDTNATRVLTNTGTTNNPAWAQVTLTSGVTGTLPVANGGTSLATLTAHALYVGNGTSAPTALAVGTNSQLLMANTTNDPSWTTPTFPTAATPTTRKIIVSDGTNWVASTETYATPSTSGNVMTSNGTNWTSAAAPAGNLLIATKTLTNTNIKALHATPIEVIAAPGNGKGILIVSASYKFVYGGSNAFTAAASQTITLYYNNNTSLLISGSNFISNATITSTASKFGLNYPLGFVDQAAGVIDNVNVAAWNSVATEITGNVANDNTIDIQVGYYIVTF